MLKKIFAGFLVVGSVVAVAPFAMAQTPYSPTDLVGVWVVSYAGAEACTYKIDYTGNNKYTAMIYDCPDNKPPSVAAVRAQMDKNGAMTGWFDFVVSPPKYLRGFMRADKKQVALSDDGVLAKE